MIEKIVEARRNLRYLKNLIKGKFLEKTEYLDMRLTEALAPYLANNKVQIFGIDSTGRAYIFTANNYSGTINQTMNIDKALDMKQTKIHHQKFSRKNSITDYYDADYQNNNYKLKIIAKIER